MKKLKLKENEVVHCATLKQAKKVLKIANELGLTWRSGESYLNNFLWDAYKENTCYNLNYGEYSSLQYNKDKCRTVINSKQFIKRHKNKSKYKSLEDRINVLEAIVNATNESVTIVKSEEAIEENKYISEEQKDQIKKYSQLQIQLDKTKAYYLGDLSELQLNEIAKFYFENKLKTQCFNDVEDVLKFFKERTEEGKLLNYYKLDSSEYLWGFKPNNKKEVINALTLFEPQKPQIGDVVKAWDYDKSKFVYGVLESIYEDSLYPYDLCNSWFKNIEKVTEISINDFRK